MNTYMLFIQLLLSGVAACQLVEVLHHGSFFAGMRDFANRQRTASPYLAMRWLGELLHCPFCLSHWAAALCVGLVVTAQMAASLYLLAVPVWILAATRIANLLNDVTHAVCRSPGELWTTERRYSSGNMLWPRPVAAQETLEPVDSIRAYATHHEEREEEDNGQAQVEAQ